MLRWSRPKVCLVLLVPAALLLSGCERVQNSLKPQSHEAKDIASLFWWMMGGAWIGLALVVGLLLLSWKRANKRGFRGDTEGLKPGERPGWYIVVGAGIVLPIVLLSALFVIADLFVIRTTEAPAKDATKLTVRVTGHQWWWEIRYPESGVVTANEIHIPVHTPVRLEVESDDVIHSFWVPQLQGKMDLIPGQTNTLWIQADKAGDYRGQCAEYCGLQHAHMAIHVIAEQPEQFQAWMKQQQAPAQQPADAQAMNGQQLFLGSACVYCHAVSGTNASGTIGPDLSHLASRGFIGAGTLKNDPQHLGDWILDPQDSKPGNYMPPTNLDQTSLDALLSYLEGLK
jgi:cytochrome c oxidase subunit II